jgi:hypothetical protein
MTAKGWDDIQPSAPFKIGELVKIIAGSPGKRKGSFAIVASEYYQGNYHGPMVDVMIGEKTHAISPYHLERVNND